MGKFVSKYAASDIEINTQKLAVETYRNRCNECMDDYIEAVESNDWRLIHISKTHLVFFDGEKTMIEPLEGIEDRENVFFKVNGKNYMEM